MSAESATNSAGSPSSTVSPEVSAAARKEKHISIEEAYERVVAAYRRSKLEEGTDDRGAIRNGSHPAVVSPVAREEQEEGEEITGSTNRPAANGRSESSTPRKTEFLAALRALDEGSKGFLTEQEWRQAFATFPELVPVRSGIAEATLFWDIAATQTMQHLLSFRASMVSFSECVVAFFESFISGGIAGAVAKTVIAPGDRVKIIYQVSSDRAFSLASAFKSGARIVERGGVLDLWRGHGATLLRVVPHASVSYASFPQYEILFGMLLGAPKAKASAGGSSGHDVGGKENTGAAVMRRFLSGAAAGASASTISYPFELLRARYAAHWSFDNNRYPSYFAAIREIREIEGWPALFSGLRPTLAGVMPYAGLSFCVFESLKSNYMYWKGLRDEREMRVWHRLLIGSVAGWTAQSATYPLDIVRRRMQVHPERYRSIRGALVDIYKKEGVTQGLFKGLSMNWIKGPIAMSISFTINDEVKNRIRKYHAHVVASKDRFQREDLNPGERLACGAMAGGLAKLWSTPFDRLKIIYSLGLAHADEHNYAPHAVRTMKDLAHHLTPTSHHWWQGGGAMMIRAMPLAAITYASFEPWRGVWKRASFTHESTLAVDFLAGGSAAALSTILLHPLDVMRVKSAMHPSGRPFPSYWIGVRETFATGGLPSLFIGWRAAVLGIAPMAGIGFGLYEHFKRNYALDSFQAQLAGGMAAGWSAQLVTYPLNVVRRRAQAAAIEGSLSVSPRRTGGVFECIFRIAAKEGFYGGLYSRMPMGWVFGTTTIGLSFALNDMFRRALVDWRNSLYDQDLKV